MTHLKFSLFTFILSMLPSGLAAEQIVVTKSGSTLIGEVAFDDDAVIIKIAEGELRVPLAEVIAIATITADAKGDARNPVQAQRLLLKALEARLLDGRGEESVGYLAEASRLAPENSQIAFWYARSLVDAGQGKAANEFFQQHRAAISASYPSMASALAARIERRVELESLPHELVKRIDRLNEVAEAQPIDPDRRLMFAVFRVVDQHQSPVPESAFQIQCSGQDEKIEAFDRGYYLLTFAQNRHTQGESCSLRITKPGYQSRIFEFSASPSEVKSAGPMVVTKYDESAKTAVYIQVVDGSGEPVAGALVGLYSRWSRNSSSNKELQATTDAKGNVELLAFPSEYSYRVTADGMNSANGQVEVKKTGDVPQTKVTLYQALHGSLRVVWLRMTQGDRDNSSSGETTLALPTVGRGYHPGELRPEAWLRSVQLKDQLVVHVLEGMFGYSYPRGPQSSWVGRVEVDAPPDAADRSRTADQQFEAIDLRKIEELKKQYPRVESGNLPSRPPRTTALVVKQGDVFVGTFGIREPRSNGMVDIAFKIFVEKLAPAGEPAAEP